MGCATLAAGDVRPGFGSSAGALLAAADHRVLRGHADADGRGEAINTIADHGEPAPGVEQVGYRIADVGQLQPRYRAVIPGLDCAFVFEGEGVASALGQAVRQGDADGRVLADPLNRKRLAAGLEHARGPQRIV